MKATVKNTIIENNKSALLLEKAGYSLQGRVKNMDKVAIEKNGELFFYCDYASATKDLL